MNRVTRKPVKYLTNKELLAEIAQCKKSYCSFVDETYSNFDAIVNDLAEVTDEFLEIVCARRSKDRTPKGGEVVKVVPHGLVIRLMTYDHIPLDPDRKRKSRAANQTHAMTSFPPFKHYLLEVEEDGTKTFREVGRSHWEGGLENGWFNPDKGRVSERMGMMYFMLVERYSRRGNWRNYSYIDEMKSLALMQLAQVGLQFDESKSSNPFAFYTTTVTNCLSGETEILTREYGSVPIENIAGEKVTILDGNGDWLNCLIMDYGVQNTRMTSFQNGSGTKIDVWSTDNHRWISYGESVTTAELHKGRTVVIDDLRPSKQIANQESYRNGVIHGLVYGDGAYSHTRESGEMLYRLRLCANKEETLPYLEEFAISYPPSASGDPYIGSISIEGKNLKKFPEQPGSDLDYLLGFLRGWFGADGCVSEAATPTLCGDDAEYVWLKKWGPLVGWHTNNFTKLSDQTNFGPRKKISLNIHLRKSSMDISDFINSHHAQRWDQRKTYFRVKDQGTKYDWKAIEGKRANGETWNSIAEQLNVRANTLISNFSIRNKIRQQDSTVDKSWKVYGSLQSDDTRSERVYCPVVPTTHSLALPSGIHTGQCFTRIFNVEKKNQNIRDDLLIAMGSAPSYTRQIDNELSQNGNIEPKAIPTRRGRKTAVQVAAEKEAQKPVEE